MRKLILIVFIFFLAGCFEFPEPEDALVVGISDGDSIKVVLDGKQERVRLAYIDAPEFHQAFGKKSRKNLSDLIYKKRVKIASKNFDRYGRIIAEVYFGETNINIEQLKGGFAWHYKRHAKEQTLTNEILYSEAEDEAREKNLGLWSDEDPVPPWRFRKDNPRRN